MSLNPGKFRLPLAQNRGALHLDDWLVTYNTKRPHQGRGMNGRTPLKAFTDGLNNAAAPSPKKPKGEPLTQSQKQASMQSETRAA